MNVKSLNLYSVFVWTHIKSSLWRSDRQGVYSGTTISEEHDNTLAARGQKELLSMFDQRVNVCWSSSMEASAVLMSAGCGHMSVWRSGDITYLLGLSEVTASAAKQMLIWSK